MAGDREENHGNAPEPDGESGRITTIAELKAEQDRQAGILDELLSLVKGDKSGRNQPAADPGTGGGLSLDEIRQAVRDVGAEQARQQADAAHAAEHDRLRKPPEPENSPRESMPTWKQKLQQVTFGIDT